MKRALLALLMTAVLSAVAFAGPSLNPWFEIVTPDTRAAVSTLDAGISIEGMLSPAWFINLGGTYNDENLLDDDDNVGVGFEATIGFDERLTVNTTGSLIVGCSFSMSSDAIYYIDFPDDVTVIERTTEFVAEGRVGPLTIWYGIGFPWNVTWLDFVPTSGVRVDFDIDL